MCEEQVERLCIGEKKKEKKRHSFYVELMKDNGKVLKDSGEIILWQISLCVFCKSNAYVCDINNKSM